MFLFISRLPQPLIVRCFKKKEKKSPTLYLSRYYFASNKLDRLGKYEIRWEKSRKNVKVNFIFFFSVLLSAFSND